MINEQKAEQSVMVSIDDILSQNPNLNIGILNTSFPVVEKKNEIDLQSLQKAGAISKEEFVMPMNIANIPFQQIQLKEKKTSSALISFLILMGATGLVITGIYLGEILKKNLIQTDTNPVNVVNNQIVTGLIQDSFVNKPDAIIIDQFISRPSIPVQTNVKENAQAKEEIITDKKKKKINKNQNIKISKNESNTSAVQNQNVQKTAEVNKPILQEQLPTVNDKIEKTTTNNSLPDRLDVRDILNVVRKNQPAINRCKVFTTSDTTKVSVRIVIESTGNVQSTEILDNNYKNSELGKCIQDKIKNFKFPAFNTPTMGIKFPFSF
jgi:hypothetical protein